MRPSPAAVLALLAAPPAWGQDRSQEVTLEQLRPMIEQAPDEFFAQMVGQLYQAAPDGRLTSETLAAMERLDRAERRARLLAEWLAYDLDGDLAVEPDEIATLRAALTSERRAVLETALALLDADGDGAIVAAEMTARADRQTSESGGGRGGARTLMAFDLDGDDAVTVEELREAIDLVAAGELAERACALPPPSPEAEVVLLVAYNGPLLSAVAVAGQDETTGAARLVVEPGEAPLYVVATAFESVLWAFEGETSRIERVVAGIGQAEPGVAGVEPGRVTFVPTEDCLPEWHDGMDAGDALRLGQALERSLGQEADHVVTRFRQGAVGLPSGDARAVESGGELLAGLVAQAMEWAGEVPERRRAVREEERWALRLNPGGLLDLDPAAVVAPDGAERYEVLPQAPGMLQLLATGALDPRGRAYRIARPIPRFPPGLYGGHRRDFFLAEGVPMPDGTPGHSGVVDEATGRCLTQRTCLAE